MSRACVITDDEQRAVVDYSVAQGAQILAVTIVMWGDEASSVTFRLGDECRRWECGHVAATHARELFDAQVFEGEPHG